MSASSPSPMDTQSDADSGFTVVVVPVGKKVRIELELPEGASTTVQQVQHLIHEKEDDFEPAKQLLISSGRRLEPSKSLADYNIQNGAVLHVGLSRKPKADDGVASASSQRATASQPQSSTTSAASSDTSSGATSFDDTRTKDRVLSDVVEAFKLLKRLPRQQYVEAVKMLNVLIANLVDKPTDPKYRRVRKTNKKIERVLLAHEGGTQTLRALGFRESVEEPDSLFVRTPSKHLAHVRTLLEEALRYHGLPVASAAGSSGLRDPSSADDDSGTSGTGAGLSGLFGGLGANSDFMQNVLAQAQQLMQSPDVMQNLMQQMQNAPQGDSPPWLNFGPLFGQQPPTTQQQQQQEEEAGQARSTSENQQHEQDSSASQDGSGNAESRSSGHDQQPDAPGSDAPDLD